MKKYILVFLFVIISSLAIGQGKPKIVKFGVIDTAELRTAECDFEKGANAEILLDKADITANYDSVVMTRIKRVKIYNDRANDEASIRLSYYNKAEEIQYVHAQTIRLENNKIIITKVDPKLIYTEATDKNSKTIIFTFSDVKPGCVLEYTYKWKTKMPSNFPVWLFQSTLPTRYSEVDVMISNDLDYKIIKKGYQNWALDSTEKVIQKKQTYQKRYMALEKVPSVIDEPYVSEANVNYQMLAFQLHSVTVNGQNIEAPYDTWLKISMGVLNDEDFGGQMKQTLGKEDTLLNKIPAHATNIEKISFLFNAVKKSMKWNNNDKWYCDEGLRRAWSKHTGSSTEINLILYHLLTQAGVKAYPLLVSTPAHGAIQPNFASFSAVNKAVVYVPIDTVSFYILDASGKYNVYDQVPFELLDTYGLIVNRGFFTYNTLALIESREQALQVVNIVGEIKPDSKVVGNTVMTNYSYMRTALKKLYDKVGEKKYVEALNDDRTHLKISDLSFENMPQDTLPLIQKFNFKMDLPGSDENYMYFNPNLFTPLQTNPFVSEHRLSDIDFGSRNVYRISGSFKLPPGYKIDVMPKPTQLSMIDKSIVLKRIVGEQDGYLEVNYALTFKRSRFQLEEYKMIHDFYKTMYDLINEPIVLKKS